VNFGAGITVNNINVDNEGSKITANIVIASNAATGARTVTVTTPAGTVSLQNAFNVTAPSIGDGGGGTPADTTPPTVILVTPANGATNVPINGALRVKFSEPVNLPASTFTLSPPVNGTITWNGTSYTAIFTPAANLALNTTYTVTITTGVTDLAGNLANNYSWNFTTQSTLTAVSISAPATVTAGTTLDVYVNIGQVTNLLTYQFEVTYDNLVIQVIGVEGGTGVTSGLISSTTMPMDMWGFLPSGVPGKIGVVGRLSVSQPVTGQGYLAHIHFQVVGSAGHSSNLSLSNVVLYDSDLNRITPPTQNGSITISAQ
jgi:hypothetical protein